jgi:hypothetical protein
VRPSILLLFIAIAPVTVVHAEPPPPTVEAAAKHLLALLADPTPGAGTELRRRVDAGAPPGALTTMLDAYRTAPRIDVLDVVQALASYRRTDVRGRALAAWAEVGGAQSDRAIAAAASDVEPAIRKLAVALASRHPSPAAAQTIADLLARDEALAAELEADEVELVPGDPP